MNSVNVSRRILEGIGKRVVGKAGTGKKVQGYGLAFGRNRSCDPPVWCREENSDTDRESDSASPIHWVVLVDHKRVLRKHSQTTPRMELYRDGATLYKCTPTETADHSPPPHYAQVGDSSLYRLCVFPFLKLGYYLWRDLPSLVFLLLLCVVRWGRLGVSVSPEHHTSALPDHDPPLRPLHIHGPQKDSLQRLHFKWDTVTERKDTPTL